MAAPKGVKSPKKLFEKSSLAIGQKALGFWLLAFG